MIQDAVEVTIGDNWGIGGGSIVTRDISPNSFAAGVPCKVIRDITEADSIEFKAEILADNRVISETGLFEECCCGKRGNKIFVFYRNRV